MLDMRFGGLMFTECGNLELLEQQEEKRKNTQAWCDKRGCKGWRQIILFRLPVIVFDDTKAIYH